MARVLRESRRAAGLPEEEAEDEEAQLQRILRESAMEAEKKQGEGGEGEGADVLSPRALSDGLTGEEGEEGEEAFADEDEDLMGEADDWGEDGAESVGAGGDAAEEAGAIAPAPAPAASTTATATSANGASRRSERSMCPYCLREFADYEALIAHMQTCEDMED
jgi:hypothetical protein